MTEPDVDERPPSATRDHPPFRMRDRRSVVLPDLRPPTLEELRWAARRRRERRESPVPEPRRPHGPADEREPADVVASIEAPVVEVTEPELVEAAPVEVDPVEVDPVEAEAAPLEDEAAPLEPAWPAAVEESWPATDDPRPWRPVVLPDPAAVEIDDDELPIMAWPEPIAAPVLEPAPQPAAVEPEPATEPYPDEPPSDEVDLPPLVSHILVVREPAPPDPGRIAVLDEPAVETATVTRLVPLEQPVEDSPVERDADPVDAVYDVPSAVDGRAAPLYWRLLRLRHTRPNGWLRALFFEGAVAVAVVLVLAEAASVWTIVVLPFVVAVVVKANDVLAGSLRRTYRQAQPRSERDGQG
ncbi:MAG TPA: hypothetical protein VG650_06725 [Mycobacteriales bacterium]|nr:hypothetical protein [Mycobacteriales bacterium]